MNFRFVIFILDFVWILLLLIYILNSEIYVYIFYINFFNI